MKLKELKKMKKQIQTNDYRIELFQGEINKIKDVFLALKKHVIIGTVAFIRGEIKTIKYAIDKGLFLIKATGDSAVILNDKKFNLKNF
ncbi:MAG: hypothetical protein KatS3mg027_2049 [Bacteroidia bacterium]|nr:MAG: hypothetical protein KatS3mg027_2049 [Bacteroidia bacterium]